MIAKKQKLAEMKLKFKNIEKITPELDFLANFGLEACFFASK
jgi:hypothetical protein